MNLREPRTWLVLFLALVLNVVWASGGDWVLCTRTDAPARVTLRGAHGCDDGDHGTEHGDGLCLASDCDDLPIGHMLLAPHKGHAGNGKRLCTPSSPQYPDAGFPARASAARASAESVAPPHSLVLLRTVVLRL